MNRRQKKERLKRRQHHTDQFQGMTKVVKHHDGSEIEQPRGRVPRPGLRRRKQS